MTGLELQQRLSGVADAPPVIMVTAHDAPGTRERCLAAGASHYLRKPVDGNTLIESIRSVVDQAI